MNKLLRKYNRLEANNDHTKATAMLVELFGTDDEKQEIKEIAERQKKNQYIESADYRRRYELNVKYYHLITK